MTTTPAPVEGVTVEDLDDSLCLYRRDTDEVLVLNESAGDIWRLIDGTTTVEEIAVALSAAYAVEDPAALGADVEAVIGDLCRRGYIRDAGDEPGTAHPA